MTKDVSDIINNCVVPARPDKVKHKKDKPKNIDNISVIIVGGDFGYRMKSYGPQCMLKVKNNKTLLQYQVNVIRSVFPNSEIILVTRSDNDRIVKNKPSEVRIVENQIHEITNEIEQVRIGINNAYYDKVLIIYSNLYFNDYTINNIPLITSSIIYSSSDMISKSSVGVTIIDEKATILSYGIVDKKWCDIIYITGKELKYLKNVCYNRDNSKMYMFEGINKIIDKHPINAIEPLNMHIVKIERLKDMEKIR